MSNHPMLDLSQWDDVTSNPAVLVADGAKVEICVRGGCLVVKDGPKNNPRERIIARVPRIIRHVVILSMHGYISLDAMSWMKHCDITWTCIDRSEKTPHVVETSAGNLKPDLVRKQAFCAPNGPMRRTGLAIWQEFITKKLEGQAWNAENLLGNPVVSIEFNGQVDEVLAAKFIRDRIIDVELADTISQIIGFEGQGAKAYWASWNGLPVQWLKPVPPQPHWQAYGVRRTLRRAYADNRNATDPINAMLNYGYKIAETECVNACYGAWLSPSLGIGHVVKDGRDSFAQDLIETIRPRVDQIILKILERRLDKRMFYEEQDGTVRVRATLTHEIAHAVHGIAYMLQSHVQSVTKMLEK